MVRRVAQIDWLRGFADKAHQPFALFHARAVDGVAVQSFGGEQFVDIAGAAEINRADLRHHICGDHPHQLVESRLGACGSAMISRSRRSRSRGPPATTAAISLKLPTHRRRGARARQAPRIPRR